jgi:hypothetical protein
MVRRMLLVGEEKAAGALADMPRKTHDARETVDTGGNGGHNLNRLNSPPAVDCAEFSGWIS